MVSIVHSSLMRHWRAFVYARVLLAKFCFVFSVFKSFVVLNFFSSKISCNFSSNMKIYRRVNGSKVPIFTRIRFRESEDVEMKILLKKFDNFDYDNCHYNFFSQCCLQLAQAVKRLYLDVLFDEKPPVNWLREMANYCCFCIPEIGEAYLNFKIKSTKIITNSPGTFRHSSGAVNTNLFHFIFLIFFDVYVYFFRNIFFQNFILFGTIR